MYQINLCWTDNFGTYRQASIVCDICRLYYLPTNGEQQVVFTTDNYSREYCENLMRDFSRVDNCRRDITIIKMSENDEGIFEHITLENCSVSNFETDACMVMGNSLIYPERSNVYRIYTLCERVTNHHQGNLVPLFAQGVPMYSDTTVKISDSFKTIVSSIVKDL